MSEALIIIVLSGFLVLREVLHYKERKDMLDRLMSKTFVEYKDNAKLEENKLETEDDGTTELVDAKDELYGEEKSN